MGEVAVVPQRTRALLQELLAHLSPVHVRQVNQFLLGDGGSIKAQTIWLLGAQAEAIYVLNDDVGASILQNGLYLVLQRPVHTWLASLVTVAHSMLRIHGRWILHF